MTKKHGNQNELYLNATSLKIKINVKIPWWTRYQNSKDRQGQGYWVLLLPQAPGGLTVGQNNTTYPFLRMTLLWSPKWPPSACHSICGGPHVLSALQHAHFLIRLFPFSNLPAAASIYDFCSLVPNPIFPLRLGTSDHLSRLNSNTTFPLSLSNYLDTPTIPLYPWAVISPFSEILPQL